ncbi:MAG TPA: hypothetical protein VK949_04410 [Methylotenera sp.]|nr:hypothetical protein [Methylotenera sp.]
MKLLNVLISSTVLLALASCANDGPKMALLPQNLIQQANEKYPDERTNLIFIGAPEGVIAPGEAVKEVSSGVDSGKVVAIISSLKIKTSTVIIAGNDEDLTAATLEKALVSGKDQISGAKIIYVNGKTNQGKLRSLAESAGVNIEFMDSPA